MGSAVGVKLALNRLIASVATACGTSLAFVGIQGIDVGLFMELLLASAL